MEQRYSVPPQPIQETESNHLAVALRQLRELHGSGLVSPFFRACREIHEVHQSLFERGEVEK